MLEIIWFLEHINIDISSGADGCTRSHGCACATLCLVPHQCQRIFMVYMSGWKIHKNHPLSGEQGEGTTNYFHLYTECKISRTWQAGNILQGISPRNHCPVKPVMGVRGAAVRHIMVSERDMLHTSRLVPVRRSGVLITVRTMMMLPTVPIMETRP